MPQAHQHPLQPRRAAFVVVSGPGAVAGRRAEMPCGFVVLSGTPAHHSGQNAQD